MKKFTLAFIALMLLVGCSQQPVKEVSTTPLVNQSSMVKMRYYNNCSVVFHIFANISQANGGVELAKSVMGYQRGAQMVADNLLWIDYIANNEREVDSLAKSDGLLSAIVTKSRDIAKYHRESLTQDYVATAEISKDKFFESVYRDLDECMSEGSLTIQQAYLDALRSLQ